MVIEHMVGAGGGWPDRGVAWCSVWHYSRMGMVMYGY